jgi:hypothetical protein
MEDSEREAVREHLDRGYAAILEATAGLTENQASFRPAPDRWSVRDCVEHVAVAEGQMLDLVASRRRAADPRSADREVDRRILAVATDRERKFSAPEIARPSARFATLRSALEEFEACRRKTLRYVANCAEDLRAFTTKHPLMGVIDCYQCLLLIAVHPSRHALQVLELREHPDFPSA